MTPQDPERDSPGWFEPQWFRDLDAHLLRNYAIVWASRAHRHIRTAVLALLLASAMSTAASMIFGLSTVNDGSFLAAGLVVAIGLLPIVSLPHDGFVPTGLRRAPDHPVQDAARFALGLVWSLLISFVPMAITLSARGTITDITPFVLFGIGLALWMASILYIAPILALELLLGLYLLAFSIMIGAIPAVLVGFLWRRLMGVNAPTWSVGLASVLGGGIWILMAWSVLKERVMRRYVSVLGILVLPFLLGVFAAIFTIDKTLSRSIGLALGFATAASLGVLLMLLPRLQRQYIDLLMTPECNVPIVASVSRTLRMFRD